MVDLYTPYDQKDKKDCCCYPVIKKDEGCNVNIEVKCGKEEKKPPCPPKPKEGCNVTINIYCDDDKKPKDRCPL